jgi:hypothetical protein
MRLTDVQGNPIGYLPVSLNAGEESIPLILRVYPEGAGERLRSASNPEAQILGRLEGAGVYSDLSVAPIGLDAYVGGYASVEVKVAASAVVRAGAAAWLV